MNDEINGNDLYRQQIPMAFMGFERSRLKKKVLRLVQFVHDANLETWSIEK